VANLVKNSKSLSAARSKDPLRQFANFMWKTWRTLRFPDPTRIHYDVADYMQNGPEKQIDMGFRGMAKSYIAVTKANHSLYVDPEEEIVLTVSATTNAAKQNSFFAWQMIQEFDWLAHLRPSPDQRQSTQAFDVRGATPKKSESFAAMSLFGQITGRRARLAIPDDIEIPTTSDTEDARADLRRAHSEIPGAILLPGGREIMLGTAQNEQSIYTELATEKGYAMRMWPSEYPKEDELPKFGTWLSPMLAGDLQANPGLAGLPTEPSRFGIEVLIEKEVAFGRIEYARQFKLHLDAGAGNAAPLKLRDITCLEWSPPSVQAGGQVALLLPPDVRWGPSKATAIKDIQIDTLAGDSLNEPSYCSPPGEWLPADTRWMYVDPSGAGTDETTWSIGAGLSALAFICRVGASIEGHTEAVLKAIAADAKLWGVNYIFVESNFGQGMFAALLRPHLTEINHPCVIEDDRKGATQKERRIIETLEPPFTAHRIVFNRAIFAKDYASVEYPNIEDARKRFYRLSYQITRITKVKGCIAKDDRVDGLASLLAKFVERMKQRTADAIKADKEAAFLEELKKMIATRQAQGLPTYGAELMPGMSLGADPLGGFGRPAGKKGSHLT
jgi:hypothetical protein